MDVALAIQGGLVLHYQEFLKLSPTEADRQKDNLTVFQEGINFGIFIC